MQAIKIATMVRAVDVESKPDSDIGGAPRTYWITGNGGWGGGDTGIGGGGGGKGGGGGTGGG